MLVGRSVTLEFIIAITIEITNHHSNQTAVMEMSYSFYHSYQTIYQTFIKSAFVQAMTIYSSAMTKEIRIGSTSAENDTHKRIA